MLNRYLFQKSEGLCLVDEADLKRTLCLFQFTFYKDFS